MAIQPCQQEFLKFRLSSYILEHAFGLLPNLVFCSESAGLGCIKKFFVRNGIPEAEGKASGDVVLVRTAVNFSEQKPRRLEHQQHDAPDGHLRIAFGFELMIDIRFGKFFSERTS